MCDDTCQPYQGCCCTTNNRRFFTKDEQIENLHHLKTCLEKEIKGIEERIQELSQ